LIEKFLSLWKDVNPGIEEDDVRKKLGKLKKKEGG